ncbi:diguanylate cyclase domain-containing protein [Agarivorans sp. MS3-6]|uniref:GGDEF domain-containing protein n=1 Tax=Agarivorans sp. TSD2052 TaxID=2937286 RepID=UPI0020103CF7|nr:sensor domain-containing diguanylate cyclase [Agarivorans sp. TSD2052]UPW19736.1 sensor domain-containing diguanylate cyclase [Agarivorans sp. TSD2052]
MSYNRYQSEWDTRISHAVSSALNVSNGIIDLVSPSAAGLNYTNIKLQSALDLYAASEDLLYFEVDAISDFSAKQFAFAYAKELGQVWKTNISDADIAQQEQQIHKLQQRLSANDSDQVKLAFLLGRAQERLLRFHLDQKHKLDFEFVYSLPQIELGGHLLDSDNQRMLLHLALRNQKGGSIWLFFDAQHLFKLQHDIQMQLVREAMVAILFSVLLIMWASWWIVKPIKRLAESMSGDVADINLSGMTELTRKDELGVLARRFDLMVKRVQGQMVELEQRSSLDPLTKLGSRFLFEKRAPSYLKQASRSNSCVGFLICDLDNFKAYNDGLGHPEGDSVLRRVGLSIQSTMRRASDMAFRLGGEEFVILLQTQNIEDIQQMAMQLCQQLEGLEIIHPKNPPFDVVTMSIGVAFVDADDLPSVSSIDPLYQMADEALYRAKSAGRNAIEMKQWVPTNE